MTPDRIPTTPPAWFNVEMYAAVYGIGRHVAYANVRLWHTSSGREGMPNERVGKKHYRISRYELEKRLGGPVPWPIPGYHPEPQRPEPAPPARARRKRPPDDGQPQLFIA